MGEGVVVVGGGEDYTTLEFLFQPHLYLPSSPSPKPFLHLTSPGLRRQVVGVCEALGQAGDLTALLLLLLEGLTLGAWRREVLWLLGVVVDSLAEVQGREEEQARGREEGLRKVLQALVIGQGAAPGAVERVGGGAVVSEGWSEQLLEVEVLGKVGRVIGRSLGPDTAPLLLHLLHTTDLQDRWATHLTAPHLTSPHLTSPQAGSAHPVPRPGGGGGGAGHLHPGPPGGPRHTPRQVWCWCWYWCCCC